MSEKYKFTNPDGIYFVTFTIVFWIDLFTRKEYVHILIDILRYYQAKRELRIHAYCIMLSHLHLILSSEQDSLSALVRDFKKFSNRKIIQEIELINESRKECLPAGIGRVVKSLSKCWKKIEKN